MTIMMTDILEMVPPEEDISGAEKGKPVYQPYLCDRKSSRKHGCLFRNRHQFLIIYYHTMSAVFGDQLHRTQQSVIINGGGFSIQLLGNGLLDMVEYFHNRSISSVYEYDSDLYQLPASDQPIIHTVRFKPLGRIQMEEESKLS